MGATAGGPDTLERGFNTLPIDSGAAFRLVQPLSPDHKFLMVSLFSRHTAMPARAIEDEMPLAANELFLVPPGKHRHLVADRLTLVDAHGSRTRVNAAWADGTARAAENKETPR